MITPKRIWLADLTYTQQSLASDVVPAAIGGLAEIVKKTLGMESKVFKLPENLLGAIEVEQPDIIGFSNYVWNATLSLTIASLIKAKFPNITIVMGGPNIPSVSADLEYFLNENRQIDFAVIKEGEIGLINIIKLLINGFERDSIVTAPLDFSTDGFSYLGEGDIFYEGKLARFMNLEELPSPYLSGRMDEFLDGRFMPVIQTNRGCPFTCTFCTEGQSYWSKVRKKPIEVLQAEVKYIAKIMGSDSEKRKDLLIADSNFGMYDPDQEVARTLRDTQETYGWPTYINVATGKNKKEKVLETARIVNGAMNLAGSVQSLDEKVLINIKRDNISPDALLDMALLAAEIGTNTYSEVILALPGETKVSHFSTLKKLVDAGFTMLAMYQMMLLPATEMNSADTRDKYGFVTRFRLLPRCYGVYKFFGEEFTSAEIEEIVVSHKEMSLDDYLECRIMHFFITTFYNDGVFLEFHRLLQQIGGSSYEWIEAMHGAYKGTEVEEFVSEFVSDTLGELYEDRITLENHTKSTNFLNRAILGEIGNNVLYFHKGRSLTKYLEGTMLLAQETLLEYLQAKKLLTPALKLIIADMFKIRVAQLENIFNLEIHTKAVLNFPEQSIPILDLLFKGKDIDLLQLSAAQPEERMINFSLSDSQLEELISFNKLFGNSDMGISRILSRVYLRNFFRKSIVNTENGQTSYIPGSQFGFRES